MARIVESKDLPHPPPPAERRQVAALLFAVFGTPIAWSVQLIVDYALTAEACFPNDRPLPVPMAGFAWDRSAAIAVNLLALLIAAIATWTALGVWRRERAAGSTTSLSRTRDDRTCFMAMCGLFTGFGFIGAILFNTVTVFGVPQCSG